MSPKSLLEVFESFKKLKVLIIGDVMVDSYIYGSVDRISPEAPVPVMHVQKRENRLGGAANVALNIQSLGAEPILCSIIGDDIPAETFKTLLKSRKMSDRGIINSAKRTTTVKNRVISAGHHLLRIDEEQNESLDTLDRKALIAHIQNITQECDVVIIEDYDKGTLDEEVIAATVAYAKAQNVPVAVDPKKKNFLSYKGVTLFKPNLKELNEGLNVNVDPTDILQIDTAVEKLQVQLDFEKALITLSEHGVYFKESDMRHQLPAHVRSISDVSGAGDTVISIASLCMVAGVPSEVLTELANLGGGIVCEYPGVVPIDTDRLLKEAIENELIASYLH
jgi:rfaE bifunctional protein kinase chain/domain